MYGRRQHSICERLFQCGGIQINTPTNLIFCKQSIVRYHNSVSVVEGYICPVYVIHDSFHSQSFGHIHGQDPGMRAFTGYNYSMELTLNIDHKSPASPLCIHVYGPTWHRCKSVGTKRQTPVIHINILDCLDILQLVLLPYLSLLLSHLFLVRLFDHISENTWSNFKLYNHL